MSNNSDLTAGWGWPVGALRVHYFRAGNDMSLCEAWSFYGERFVERFDRLKCLVCLRKLEKGPSECLTK